MFFNKTETTEDRTNKQQIKSQFNNDGFANMLGFIKKEIGIDFFIKQNIIETKIKLFCKDENINSFVQLQNDVRNRSDLKQKLINLLTVNETYFYREEKQLEEAVEFAGTINGDVSIICAPCSSGEEVYSFSMMMNERFGVSRRFNILGIDINSESIEEALEGVYSLRSLHNLSPVLKDKYFTRDEDKFMIKKYLFPNVRFSKTNIFDSSFTTIGCFDILFSRNMLIYFDDECRLASLERFAKILKSEGRVFLGHADMVPKNNWLTKHGFGSESYYSK